MEKNKEEKHIFNFVSLSEEMRKNDECVCVFIPLVAHCLQLDTLEHNTDMFDSLRLLLLLLLIIKMLL